MRLKTIIKLLSLLILSLLASLAISVIYLNLDNYWKIPVSEAELMDKTKEEVLALAFEKAPRNISNSTEIQIGFLHAISSKEKQRNTKTTISPKYYNSLNDALRDKGLMEADLLRLFSTHIIGIRGRTEYYMIYFKDNKVHEVQKGYYAEF